MYHSSTIINALIAKSGNKWTGKFLILVLCFSFSLVYAQPDVTNSGSTVKLTASDGKVTPLEPGVDDDGDGIDNALEVQGFTYSVTEGLQLWDGDKTKKYYLTDPLKWSTDGDPYSDFMEVSGINMPAAISSPENHPLVAARPVITIKMTDYDVIPLATITNTQGGEQSSSFTNTTSNSNTVSASVTVGAELNPFKLVSAEVTASYSHTWTNTQSSTSSFGSNWSNTRTTQPDQAARLKLRIYMENNGGATALDVMPTINLSLGDKTIATFIPSQMANILTPPGTSDDRFPKNGTIVVEKDQSNNDIIITLDELKAIQMGTPLSLEVIQVSAKVVRWNPSDQDWNSDINWASFESEIDPVSVDVLAEMGNGTNRRYQVFAGTSYWDPEFTMEEILSLIFNVSKNGQETSIENRKYPDNWYLSSPSQKVIDEWNTSGQPQNMLPLRMHRNTKIVMMSPGSDPEPTVNLASYSGDYKRVLVSALPNNFPILKVTAEVPVNGEVQTIELKQGENSFYSNDTLLENIPDGPGSVIVENARGDITQATITLPAIYANANDVKVYSSFLPDPGGEFWIYPNGEVEKPMLLYCQFFDTETHDPLDTPREYLTMKSELNPPVYSDYIGNSKLYRSRFNKIRINPTTLKMAIRDLSFIQTDVLEGDPDIPSWITEYIALGQASWNYPDLDSIQAQVDLSGTPYHLAINNLFTRHGDETIIIDKTRKKLQIKRRNLNAVSSDYYGITGVFGDSISLIYGYDSQEIAKAPPVFGNALHFNETETSGFVDMGSSNEMRVSTALTMEAWINPTGKGVDDPWGGMIINKEGEYELFRTQDGTIRWAITNSSPGWNWQSTQYESKENEWLHVAVVYDKNEIKTYLNGVLFHSQPGSGNIGDFYGTANAFFVGGRQNAPNQKFQGLIDEVRVWNTIRSASQIQSTIADTLGSLYYSSADSGLIGYWRFDSTNYLGDGVTITPDRSFYENDGYIYGDVKLVEILPTSVKQNQQVVPESFTLNQNYPNPFNPVTTISYQLVSAADIDINIYDMLGRKVTTLISGSQQAGTYQIQWDAGQLASGTYIYRMMIDGRLVQARKMLLMR